MYVAFVCGLRLTHVFQICACIFYKVDFCGDKTETGGRRKENKKQRERENREKRREIQNGDGTDGKR